MKINVSISHGILEIGHEPLFHWRQSLEFIIESSTRLASELKNVLELVQRVIRKLYEHLKVLHTESQVFNNGKLVEIEQMKGKFIAFIDEIVVLEI